MEDEEYAVRILDVQEINRLKDLSINKIPKAPNHIKGLLNLRGEVIPVIDLRVEFNLPEKEMSKETRIIVVKVDKKAVGLLVDSVQHVLTFEQEAIGVPPEEVRTSNNYISGVGKKNNRMFFVLDIQEIIEMRAVKQYAEVDCEELKSS